MDKINPVNSNASLEKDQIDIIESEIQLSRTIGMLDNSTDMTYEFGIVTNYGSRSGIAYNDTSDAPFYTRALSNTGTIIDDIWVGAVPAGQEASVQYAVTRNGNILKVVIDPSPTLNYLKLSDLIDPLTLDYGTYILYLEYSLTGEDSVRDSFDVTRPSIYVADQSTFLKYTNLTNLDSLSYDTVILCRFSIIQQTSTVAPYNGYKALSLNPETDIYGTLVGGSGNVKIRPRFSYVDNNHRAQVGTGAVKDTNPHALSVSDLTVGNLTVLETLSYDGAVVTKTINNYGIIGINCVEPASTVPGTGIPPSQVNWDTTLSAWYVELPKFPTQVYYISGPIGNNTYDVVFFHVIQTNRVYLIAYIDLGGNVVSFTNGPAVFHDLDSIRVYYTWTKAGHPSQDVKVILGTGNTASFGVEDPAAGSGTIGSGGEVILAEGRFVTAFSPASNVFDTPRFFFPTTFPIRILVSCGVESAAQTTSQGLLITNPYPLVCVQNIPASPGNIVHSLNYTPATGIPFNLRFDVNVKTLAPLVKITFGVTGLDADGQPITGSIEFQATSTGHKTGVLVGIDSSGNPAQFTTISTITITPGGVNGHYMIMAEYVDNAAYSMACRLFYIEVTTGAITKFLDVRPITKSLTI